MADTPPPGDRIAKVLSRAGIASRREAERMIETGRVSVNGKVIDSPALNVTPSDRIAVDGKPVGDPEPPRIWLYHKPAGLVTTERDDQGRDTVFAALPEDMPRVMSVGRLDLNSEGLLLLTNDGEVKRKLELPSTGWLRRYRLRIKGSASEAKLDQLREGLTVEGVNYQPMQVSFDRQVGANAWLTISLREGKNREIRRAMQAIGTIVNRLIRVSYGPFQLGNLKAGEVEEVKRRVVRDQLGLESPPSRNAHARRSKSPAVETLPAPAPVVQRHIRLGNARMADFSTCRNATGSTVRVQRVLDVPSALWMRAFAQARRKTSHSVWIVPRLQLTVFAEIRPMMRLVFFAILVLILFAGVLAVINVLAAIGGKSDKREVDTMPRTFSRIAYVVLILLMLGVTSGLLGAS